MRRLFLPALLALSAAPLAGCVTATTAGTVQLDAHKALVTAQIAFKTTQQLALAGIKSGVIAGPLKAKVIALIVQGQRYEDAAYTGDVTAVRNLTSIVAGLQALGIGSK